MSKCYDEALSAVTCRAIVARLRGEFDNDDLMRMGPLSTDVLADIRQWVEAAVIDDLAGEPDV